MSTAAARRRVGVGLAAVTLTAAGVTAHTPAAAQPAEAVHAERDTFTYSCRSADGSLVDDWTVTASIGVEAPAVAGRPLLLDLVHVGATSSTATADALRTRYQPTTYEARKQLTYTFGDDQGVARVTDDGEYDFPEPGEPVRSNAYDGPATAPRAPSTPGTYPMRVGALRIELKLVRDGSPTTVTFTCDPPGGDAATAYLLEVKPAAPGSSTSSPSPSVTSTAAGPRVDTGVVADGDTSAIALGGLALVAAIALGRLARRRLRD